DPNRVGILGYALGGLVAAQAAHTGQFAAAASLVGHVDDYTVPVTGPYLLLLSDFSKSAKTKNASTISRYRSAQWQAAQPTSHVIEIAGADDLHFPDPPESHAWPFSRQQKPLHNRIRSIIDSYTVAFFSTYLRGTANPLMRVRHSPYPEVRFLSPRATD